MKFKSFEIRETQEYKQYEVVKWMKDLDDNPYCDIIAFIDYDFKNKTWKFSSIDIRYLENREDGLEEFILKYLELLDVSNKYTIP